MVTEKKIWRLNTHESRLGCPFVSLHPPPATLETCSAIRILKYKYKDALLRFISVFVRRSPLEIQGTYTALQ